MKKTTVAIIDKQHLFRMALKALIQDEPGYVVTVEAGNGQQFVNLIDRSFPPDIVLLDLDLPIMNGFETIRWIRENCPRIRVVVVSGDCSDEAILKAVRLGARGFLPKSAGYDELRKTLHSVKDRGYYLTDPVSDKLMQTLSESAVEFEHINPVSTLSEKELNFLKLACSEMTYKEIAFEMGISHRTVDSYRDHLFEKLQIKNRVGLAIFAVKNGLINP